MNFRESKEIIHTFALGFLIHVNNRKKKITNDWCAEFKKITHFRD